MEEPKFYGEYRKQLKAAQVAVIVKPSSERNAEGQIGDESSTYTFAIKANCFKLTDKEHSKQWTYALPAGINALPGTCSGLEWVRNQGLQFRIQLDDDAAPRPDGEGGGVPTGEMHEGSGDDAETGDPFLKGLEHPSCLVLCERCGSPLIQPSGGFSKVLPLPSGDWGDMAGDMWCCKSKVIADERGKSKPLDLRPDEGSVMVGDLHLLVNSRSLCKGSVSIEPRKSSGQAQSGLQGARHLSVICQRCGCVIGSVDNRGGSIQLETTKLYRYCIRAHCEGIDNDNILWSNPLQFTICSLMVALFKNQMTFKYIIDDEEKHEPQLLIWLLSIDTRLLCERAPSVDHSLPSSSCSQRQGETTPSSDLQGSSVQIKLQSQRIIKILYRTCTGEEGQRLSREWNKDLLVHGITLTKEACLQLRLLLATSTLKAPPSMRQMNGFRVGSMKL